VLDGVDNASRVAQEEIFGPVLSVIECSGAEEGVALANASRFELAASVWTADLSTAHRVAGALRAGTVWVNTFDAASVATPFGGGGDTGGGRDRSLAALDAYSAATLGAPFAQLAPDQQDAILRDVEGDKATGFAPNSSTFFETVREHALEGMFGDPYHGGNANFVGWDLIQFPGIKLTVPSVEQRLGTKVKPAHKSTTDYAIFKISKGG
jgi:hypothetical protein